MPISVHHTLSAWSGRGYSSILVSGRPRSTNSNCGSLSGSGSQAHPHGSIDVDEVGDMLSQQPLEGEEKAREHLRRKKFQNLPRLIGTSDALCRDAKPRSAILTQLEGSPSRSAHKKFDQCLVGHSRRVIRRMRCGQVYMGAPLSPRRPTGNNFARKALNGLTPYEFVCERWTFEPKPFTLDALQQMLGPNI